MQIYFEILFVSINDAGLLDLGRQLVKVDVTLHTDLQLNKIAQFLSN